MSAVIIAIEIILGIGVLIFVHELGHFLVAKYRGIKVEKFSLGFGPKLLGFKIGETEYMISLILFGGYVKMAGENPGEPLKGEKWEYLVQPWWSRLMVVFAGPAMNYILAIFIFSSLWYFGMKIPEFTDEPVIGDIMPSYPAYRSGIKSGDRVLDINGKKIKRWTELSETIHNSANKKVSLTVIRNSKKFKVNLIPKLDENIKKGLIGVSPKIEKYTIKKLSIDKAILTGTNQTLNITGMFFVWFKDLIRGKVHIKDSVGGPILIGTVAVKQAKSGLNELLTFIAFLSINLAVLNLFPFPVLDGGHILFLMIEGIRKKPIPLKLQMVVQQIGVAILIFIALFTTFNDILRLK